MEKIYIVLAHTGTVLARTIKIFTHAEFTHSSISLDEDLNQMYSFGRLNPYNPFIGGFIHEHIHEGTFKRFNKTKVKIYSLEVTEEQYNKIEEKIKNVEAKKDEYRFNVIGMFAASIHKKRKKENSFYCAEFVKYLLDSAQVADDLPELIKPEDFKSLKEIKEIYSGLLRKYR